MAKFHLPTLEEEQLKKWEERKVFAQIMARNADESRPRFVFFEGPPTANGKPGIHHLLGRAYKDVIPRFRTMQGYRIDRKAGWDTHGLPVELEVEKQLGFTKKQDIEQYGIAAFNAECRKSVWKYLDLWQNVTRRVGFWLDMEHPYITYKNDYVESLWWTMKEIDKQGLLYKGYRVTPHCPRCVTSLSSHELAQGYKDTEDPSVFVKFAVEGRDNTFFLVWTTTPWTLSGNVALALGPDVTYAEVKMRDTGETYILARERLSVLDGEFENVGEKTGVELVGTRYMPLYPAAIGADAEHRDRAYQTYAADFVSTGDGTGIVHIAPAFGEDDAQLGAKASLPTLHTVDPTGMVTSDSPGKGKFFKKADADVIADLTERGLLYKSGTLKHSYPFCWRCGTPILYYAKSSWYIRMSQLREQLQANNAQVNWIPDHIKDGRFGEWLREVKDWAISRERFWGTPLPVWHCDACQTNRVIGELNELDQAAPPKNRFFLQRHGEAETNVADTISSWPELSEVHLTAKGREQVTAAAKDLKEKKIDLIFASDLLRTKETAETIAAELGLPVTYHALLREIDTGDFNGKAVKEYHAALAGKDHFEDRVGNGESLFDVRRRVVAFIKEVNAAHAGKNIVIVSHGDPLWMLATAFKGLSKEEIKEWPHYNGVGEFVEMDAPKNLPYDELGNVDVHRPFIDEVTIVCKCGGSMKRVPDVCDVWFDSGAMPFAQWGYPHNHADRRRIDDGLNFPADFICEAIDQTRGWFYTLLAVSTLLGKKVPPYKNVICYGHVLDAKGLKMSKSKGNVIDPFEAMNTYGADVIRWYFYTVNQPGDSKRFDPKAVEDVTKKVFLILWNVLTYWQMNAGEKAVAPSVAPAAKNELDRWLLAELAALRAEVTAKMEAYDVMNACRSIGAFINELSTWYVRRSRDRFKAGGGEAAEAVATLGFTLRTLAGLMAPFTPFLADALYAEIGGDKESVHLEDWPAELAADAELREAMERIRYAAMQGLGQRAAVGIPIRQVLASAKVKSALEFHEWMKVILKDELNVESVEWEKTADDYREVTLDTMITPVLRRKGAARELTRTINDLRKQAGLTVKDRIAVTYAASGDFWAEVFAEHGATIDADVKADALTAGEVVEGEGSAELEAEGQKLRLRIEKIA